MHFALVACVNAFMHISGEEIYKYFEAFDFLFVFRTSGSGVNYPKIPGGSTS